MKRINEANRKYTEGFYIALTGAQRKVCARTQLRIGFIIADWFWTYTINLSTQCAHTLLTRGGELARFTDCEYRVILQFYIDAIADQHRI